MHWWYGGWGGSMMVLFWVAIILAVIWVARVVVQPGQADRSPSSQEESALEILQRRYARGEISKTEYQEMKKELQH